MGRGSSKVGSGGGSNVIAISVERAIRNAMNGNIPVSDEERMDIEAATYGLNTSKLSDSDRSKLADIVYDSAMQDPGSKNTMKTVDDINNGKVAQVHIAGFTTNELKTLVRLSAKIGSPASMFAVEDGLKLISYWQNNALPF